MLYLGGTELGKKIYLDDSKGKILQEKIKGKRVVLGIRPEDIWEEEEAVQKGFADASVDLIETGYSKRDAGKHK